MYVSIYAPRTNLLPQSLERSASHIRATLTHSRSPTSVGKRPFVAGKVPESAVKKLISRTASFTPEEHISWTDTFMTISEEDILTIQGEYYRPPDEKPLTNFKMVNQENHPNAG